MKTLIRYANAGQAHLRARLPYVRWNAYTGLLALFSLIVGMWLIYPVSYVIEHGVSKPNMHHIGNYFWGAHSFFAEFNAWIDYIGYWIRVNRAQTGLWLPVGFFVVPAISIMILVIGLGTNPFFKLPSHMGRAVEADEALVKEMKLFNGWLMVLGRYEGKLLQLQETLTVLCVAPPGTGKTTAIVVPTILECDETSMIVNDVKPELSRMTSGYRETCSIVYTLDWSIQDNPETMDFHPRWNPLSPKNMPARGPQRDLYIDRIVNIIIEEAKGNQDPHWAIKGRAFLAGLIHFISCKVEDGNYNGIPKKWHGREASLPMMIDWMNEGIHSAHKVIQELKRTDPTAAMMADPIKEFLGAAADEAVTKGYSNRSFLELNQMAATPDRERGSIMSTMDGGMVVFKNEAVRQRTCASDFSFFDIRGFKDPRDGKMKPTTVYVCVSVEDAKAMGPLTGLFVESLSAFLVSHKPHAVAKYNKNLKVGPYPVLFVLDEFPQMPKLEMLLKGPEVGRGQKVSYLLIGQDLAQIEETYGKTGVERFFANSYVKIILPVANDQAAQRFAEMVGKTGILEKNKSRTEGISNAANPFAANVSQAFKDHQTWAKSDFLSMKHGGTQVVMVQGFGRWPVVAESPRYYKDPKYKHLVSPEEGGRFPSAPTLPDFLVTEARINEVPVSPLPGDFEEKQKTTGGAVIPGAVAGKGSYMAGEAPKYVRVIILSAEMAYFDDEPDRRAMEVAAREIVDGYPTDRVFHATADLEEDDFNLNLGESQVHDDEDEFEEMMETEDEADDISKKPGGDLPDLEELKRRLQEELKKIRAQDEEKSKQQASESTGLGGAEWANDEDAFDEGGDEEGAWPKDEEAAAETPTGEKTKRELPTFREVGEALVDFINNSPVVTYDSVFELAFINGELLRIGIDQIAHDRTFSIIDWAEENLPNEDHAVESLAKLFEVRVTDEGAAGARRKSDLLAGLYIKIEELEAGLARHKDAMSA